MSAPTTTPGVYRGLFASDGTDPITSMINKLVRGILSLLGAGAEKLKTLAALIEATIKQILESIFGPVVKVVEFLGKLLNELQGGLAAAITKVNELVVEPVAALVQQLAGLASKLQDIPALIAEVAALLLSKMEQLIAPILQEAGMLFSEFLQKASAIQKFVEATILAMIEGVLKPVVQKMLEFLAGVPTAILEFMFDLLQKASDPIGLLDAVFGLFGLPGPVTLLESVVGAILRGVEPIRKIVAGAVGLVGEAANNIQLLLSKAIDLMLQVLTGAAEKGKEIASLLLSPIFAIFGAMGVFIATLTPSQEIDLSSAPIFSGISVV